MRPRRDVDRLKSEMEELFAELSQLPRIVGARAGFRPRVDVYRTDDPSEITVVAELAGVDPDEVDVAVADAELWLRGRRRRAASRESVYQQMELDYGPFERHVPLPEPVDADGVRATYADGLLTIVLPVAAPRQGPYRVQVTGRDPS